MALIITFLQKFLLELCYEILASGFLRALSKAIGLLDRHVELLRFLKVSIYRIKPEALSRQEFMDLGVIQEVDSRTIVRPERAAIASLLADGGCVSRATKKDPLLLTALSFDIEGACLQLDPMLKGVIVERLTADYTGRNISLFVLVPAPRSSKSNMLPGFITELDYRLGTLRIPLEILTHSVLSGKVPCQYLHRTKENEAILVIQPVALDDNYMEYCLSFIEHKSMSKVLEILTVIDPSSRPKGRWSSNPSERVLIKLNLTGKV